MILFKFFRFHVRCDFQKLSKSFSDQFEPVYMSWIIQRVYSCNVVIFIIVIISYTMHD